MGIELPPELADVAAQAGVAWPEADEEAMARQAQAWRDTATSMSTLATDADTTARSALSSVSGETAEAASKEWKTFVEPDSGHLTSMVRDCNAAANRLEHAANQVGTAKVEIVRNLVTLAQNQDAANAAAQAGHPFALAGMDTAVRGTAANVSHIESQLISAVQPTSSVDMATVQNPVNANPGHHLQPGITTNATNLAPQTLTDTATTLASGPGQGTDSSGQLTQGVGDLARNTTGNATDLVRHGGGVVGDTADQWSLARVTWPARARGMRQIWFAVAPGMPRVAAMRVIWCVMAAAWWVTRPIRCSPARVTWPARAPAMLPTWSAMVAAWRAMSPTRCSLARATWPARARAMLPTWSVMVAAMRVIWCAMVAAWRAMSPIRSFPARVTLPVKAPAMPPIWLSMPAARSAASRAPAMWATSSATVPGRWVTLPTRCFPAPATPATYSPAGRATSCRTGQTWAPAVQTVQ